MTTFDFFTQLASLKPNYSLMLRERLENEVRRIWGEKGIEMARKIGFEYGRFSYFDALEFIVKHTNFTIEQIENIAVQSFLLNVSMWEYADFIGQYARSVPLRSSESEAENE